MTLVAEAKEGKNTNTNNPVHLNVQCWKDHAVGPPSYWKANSVLKADFTSINISGRRGGSSDITTSRSSVIVADDSIISDSLSGSGSQRRKEDLVRDPVVILNSNGSDRELPDSGVSEEEDTADLVSGIQNININTRSSSDNTADGDSSMRTIEQTAPTEGCDLLTTVKPTEPKPTNKEIVIGTWHIQSGRSTRLETALRALSIVGVDLCFLTKTKLTNGIHTQFSWGYQVLAINAISHHQGGVALVDKESLYWQVE